MSTLKPDEREFFEKMLGTIRDKIDLQAPEDAASDVADDFELLSPKEIYAELDRFVVGQEHAKKVLSVATHNHYKRLFIWKDSNFETRLDKTNCMLIGPTGSGKTFLIRQLAKCMKVPVYIADANSLTASGYVGKDVDTLIEGLITAANDNYDAASTGIIFIDEFDKIAKRGNHGGKKDVGGESVQQALLKIIEGTVVEIEKTVGMSKVKVEIDTSNILVIVGGAFVNLEEIIQKRMKVGQTTSLGFGANITKSEPDMSILKHVKPTDLEEYGFIPEVLGRIPLTATLNKLTEEDLISILSEVEGNQISQYSELFKFSDIELSFDDGSIRAIAQLAIAQNTGARGLKTILENLLLDKMFELEEAKVTVDDVKALQSQMGDTAENQAG